MGIYIGNVMECPWMSATCSLMASFCARSERERPKSAEIERPKVKVPTSAVSRQWLSAKRATHDDDGSISTDQ